ncbi:MAG: hypothetical protein KKF46_02305 [Nanoarchaeota archaeon]|nr:hypothetical protein [Nanoarchaeota archaeon]MBU1321164.1 hypothetical protein [Nanoarchaeota archaeon]MBU1596964.1 hypothetical protein [Nanoarchaeota archaeon]MBU2441518.1 hypothetical protein [Nanoarchaeota archaeon]
MSLNVLIACKETEKEFFERKYGLGVDNLQKACSEENKDINNVLRTHDEHHYNLENFVNAFKEYGITPEIKCRVKTEIHPAYSVEDFKAVDVAVSFGGDGEALDVAMNITKKNLGETEFPKVWIERSDSDSTGALSVTRKYSYKEKVEKLVRLDYKVKNWTRVRGVIKSNGKTDVEDIALNEIYFGDIYRMGTARHYTQNEDQRSSGGLVSSKVGLLGWVLNERPASLLQHAIDDIRAFWYWKIKRPDFESHTLEYRITAPYRKFKFKHVNGKLPAGQKLTIKSTMNYDGCVSFDAAKPHYTNSRCYDFNRGKILEVSVSDEPLPVIRF